MALKAFELDPSLEGVKGQIWDRVNGYRWWKEDIAKKEGSVAKFAEGYKIFGITRSEKGFTYREWLPEAKQVFLVGEFNGWQNTTPLRPEGFGRWAVHLPDKPGGAPAVPHRCQLKVRVETKDGAWIDRVPAWTKLAWQDVSTNLFNGVCWEPPKEQRYEFRHPRPARPEALKIYEAHVGMSSMYPKVATYLDFAENVLPRIKRLGYNAVQLMAVSEHAHYGCFGYHVTSFFAPASRSGTPEELKQLVDKAHSLGLIVLMDLVHAHLSSNSLDGVAMMDGTDFCYTHGGPKGHHEQWDSKLFHCMKYEVLRFLLSNLRWWLEEYRFDGFRFDGVTSMLYHSHGIDKSFSGDYQEYFGLDADVDSHIYLMLANDLIHQLVPSAVTVAEDVSGMPTLCLPLADGGFGFDYRLAMAVPDTLIRLLREVPDDAWDMNFLCHTLTNRRWKEKCIAYCESHDQAIVGDKTIAFWLMDQEMYTGMSMVESPVASPVVDRGLALHKVLRLLVLGLGGEGYLNFMGNEFGHPEWVDFPRPENEWSHHHCRRRWDLAEDEHLRYKFFQCFDELMHCCEGRFKWLSSDHQYVSLKNEGDKVIVFERGELLFVLNLHPCQSFEGYRIGSPWGEPLRIVLDTDEGRFGGHCRLDGGRDNSFPVQEPWDGRPHSVSLYLPSRTGLVLAKESFMQGGIRIWCTAALLAHHGLATPRDLTVELQCLDEEDGKPYIRNIRFNVQTGCATLPRHLPGATFNLTRSDGMGNLCCAVTTDGLFQVHFPGDYALVAPGWLEPGKPPSPLPEGGAASPAAAAASAASAAASARPAARPDAPAAAAAAGATAAAAAAEARATEAAAKSAGSAGDASAPVPAPAVAAAVPAADAAAAAAAAAPGSGSRRASPRARFLERRSAGEASAEPPGAAATVGLGGGGGKKEARRGGTGGEAKGATARCPRGHGLKVGTPGLDTDFGTVACDECRRCVVAPEQIHRCVICNFDLCRGCAAAAAAASGDATPLATAPARPSSQPAAFRRTAAAADYGGYGTVAAAVTSSDAVACRERVLAKARDPIFGGLARAARSVVAAAGAAVGAIGATSAEASGGGSPESGEGGGGEELLAEVVLKARAAGLAKLKETVGKDLLGFAASYKDFGLHPLRVGSTLSGVWTFKEWLPGVEAASLVGDFNAWAPDATPLKRSPTVPNIWFCEIRPPLSLALTKGTRYRLHIRVPGGAAREVVPAWATAFAPSEPSSSSSTEPPSALVWPLEGTEPVGRGPPAREGGTGERIYELHPGLVARVAQRPGLREAAEVVLPRVARNGYSSVLLVGVQECGAQLAAAVPQPLGLLAPAAAHGTPEDLKAFVSRAHGLGLRVLLSVAHDGAAPAATALSAFFCRGPAAGAGRFDFSQQEVLRHLLSSLRLFVDEYGIDGFRFEGVSSMLRPLSAADVSTASGDSPAARYLMLANDLLRELASSLRAPLLASIASLTASPPPHGLCSPTSSGGLGFALAQGDEEVGTCQEAELAERLSREGGEDWSLAEWIRTSLPGCGGGGGGGLPGDRRVESRHMLGRCLETCEDGLVCRGPLKVCLLAWEASAALGGGDASPAAASPQSVGGGGSPRGGGAAAATAGGAAGPQIVSETAAALVGAGHEVHVFVRSSSARAGHWDRGPGEVCYHEVPSRSHPDFVREVEDFNGALVSAVLSWEAGHAPFDLVHGHDWLVGPACARLRREDGDGGRRMVFTVHSFAEAGRTAEIEFEACRAADRVVVASGADASEVLAKHVNEGGSSGGTSGKFDAARLRVVRAAIHGEATANTEWQPEKSGDTKREQGIDPMAPMFLFIGRLTPQKGPDLLIEALPSILAARCDARFVLVGEGHLRASLEARARDLGVEQALILAGGLRTQPRKLQALLLSCDAVIAPSRSEPFGSAVLEAWCAGKPVVATNVGGPGDFVRDGVDGYLVEPEPGSLAGGVCRICENFAHAQAMGIQARERVLREFSWFAVALQMQQIYYEALSLDGAPLAHRRRSHRPRLQLNAAGSATASSTATLAGGVLIGGFNAMAALKVDTGVSRGLAALRLAKLLKASLTSDAIITWMGSEFGNLEVMDLPHTGNGFSQERARILYDVADASGLRFKQLEMFEASMNRAERALGWLSAPARAILAQDEQTKVLVFARGRCLFAFNFHGTLAQEAFRVSVAGDLNLSLELSVILNTDDPRFGGGSGGGGSGMMAAVAAREPDVVRLPRGGGELALPRLAARAALVLGPAGVAAKLREEDAVLRLRSADAFVDLLPPLPSAPPRAAPHVGAVKAAR